MSSSSSTAKENMQMSHQAVMQPALDLREPEPPAMTFERVLNTEEAAGAAPNPPKDASEDGARRDRCRHSASATSGGSGPRPWTSGSVLAYAQSATRAVNTKGRFSLFTRTRYQYGSLETKERKKGKEVWEFRYYETDGRGERQRRAVMVGTREEYPTESAARKSPVVQAILLRLNAEQPAAAGAAEFGAVIARYEQEEMPERYSTRAAYQSLHQEPDQAALGRYAYECRQADGGGGLAEELGLLPRRPRATSEA